MAWAKLIPAALIAVAGLAVSLSATVSAPPAYGTEPKVDRLVAAVFPPWWSANNSFIAASVAGTSIVRRVGFGTVLIVASPDEASDARLYESGALALLDPLAAAGCTSLTPNIELLTRQTESLASRSFASPRFASPRKDAS